MSYCYGARPDGTIARGTLSRREFLTRAALAAGALTVPGWLAGGVAARAADVAASTGTATPGRVPLDQISIQLYTMQQQTRDDMAATLQELARIGYGRVEHAGHDGYSAAEFRKMCDDAGLVCTSSHVMVPHPFNESRWRQVCEDAVTIGQTYLVDPLTPTAALGAAGGIPSLAWGAYCDSLNRAGAIGAEHGLKVGYHNHAFEYTPLLDDPARLAIEMMLEETDPDTVHMEMDLYWVHDAGKDAIAFLETYPDRFLQFHVKDADAEGDFTDPGQGVIDFPRIFAVGERVGIAEHIVERDDAGANAFTTARVGYAYLRDVRWGAAAEPVVRLAGASRIDTAVLASADRFRGGAPAVTIATAQDFADGLAGGPIAAAADGPLLLTERDALPQATEDELRRLAPRTITVLGGMKAVADDVVRQLERATGAEVVRRAGSDRFETAAAASAATFEPGVAVAYVVSGEGFADALVAGAAAAAAAGPLLLTNASELPAVTAEELQRLDPGRIVVLGGADVVSEPVVQALSEIAPTERIAGATRYETAALAVADAFDRTGGEVYVTTGVSFPDALAAAAAGAPAGAALLPVAPEAVPPAVAAQISRLAPRRIVVLGGDRAISAGAYAELRELAAD
jgi:putative cell wall-binding protein/sugar phosphate isomerase/epimerase